MFDTGQKKQAQSNIHKTKGAFNLKNHRRVISLMLAIIMVLSMLPSAVFADVIGGNYGGNTSGNLPAGSAVGDWNAPTGTNSFVRYTLVEYPDGVLDGNITNYKVVGHSVNIYHLESESSTLANYMTNSKDASGVVWLYDSNAMDYLVNGADYIYGGPCYDGAYGKANKYVLSYKDAAQKLEVAETIAEQMTWPGSSMWDESAWDNGDYTSFFGDFNSTVDDLNTFDSKEILGNLIKMFAPETSDSSWSGLDGTAAAAKFANSTADNGTGTRYRILIEPGQFVKMGAVTSQELYFGFTLRDMLAYNVMIENSSTSKGSLIYDTTTLILNRAYNLNQHTAQFVEYDIDNNGMPISGTKQTSTNGFTAIDGSVDLDASTSAKFAQAVALREKVLGDQHMGYGLGILSPTSFVRNAGLTVTKKLVGAVDDAAKDKLWEFTLEYKTSGTGVAKPTGYTIKSGSTDITNNTSRVTKNANGFTFKAKADEPINISFNYTNGEVYYTIEETDTDASKYVTTALLNGTEVTSGSVSGNTGMANAQCVFMNSAGVKITKTCTSSPNTEFTFQVSCTKGQQALPTGSTAKVIVGGKTKNIDFHSYNSPDFALKNGESALLMFPGTWEYWITEKEAGRGYTTTANGTELTVEQPIYASTVATTGAVDFVNTKASGNAHLIIDYNFNGANATTGDGSSDNQTTSSATADCGTHNVGDTVNIAPKMDGATLTEGTVLTIPGLTGNCSVCGGAYSATMTYNGLYTKPSGGTKVSSNYTITHEGLTILYAQWTPDLTMNCTHTSTGGGNEGGGVNPTPGEFGDLYTVFWDYNYTGSAVTSSVCGEFEVWYRLDDCRISFGEGGVIDDHTDSYSRVKVTYGFSVPNNNAGEDPYRQGYTFLGWSTDRGKFQNTYGSTLTTPTAPGKSTTYYAIWRANPITWDANGGYFDFSTEAFDSSIYTLLSNKKIQWKSIVLPAVTQAPIVKYIPVREGYTFAGWFFDANCTVPITETDWGIEPDRTYYAGWTAEKVVVNYYDERQGTGIIARQTYDYDDAFSLYGDLNDTDGWYFTGWKLKKSPKTAAPGSGTILNSSLGTNVINYIEGDKDHNGSWNDPNSDPVLSNAGYWEINLVASWSEDSTSYTTTIVWNDYNNNDGCRPSSVEVGLVSSVTRQEVASKTVRGSSTSTNWSVTFDDLSITNNDASVEKVTYVPYFKSYTTIDGVKHVIQDTSATSGQIMTASVSNADTTTGAIYNYAINNVNSGSWNMGYDGTIYFNHDIITTGNDLKFSILWNDERNNDGCRPSSVILTLYANGTPVRDFVGTGSHKSQTGVIAVDSGMCDVSEDGSVWTYTFKDYQKYDNGTEIDYSAVISEYDTVRPGSYETPVYLDSATKGGRAGVLLKHESERQDYPVTIEWDDELNRDGLRPGAVRITLTSYEWNADTYRWEDTMIGTKLVTGDNTAATWHTTFENLKIYHGGQKVVYKAEVSSDLNAHIPEGSNGFTSVSNELVITISHNKDTKDVPVTIHWDDKENNDAIRPTTVIVNLWADGVKVPGAAYAATVSGDKTSDTWTYTFHNCPIYREGKSGEEIVYTITVDETVKDSLYGTYISTANGEQQKLTRYKATYMYQDGDGNTVTTDDATKSDRTWIRLTHNIDQGTVNVYASWHDDQNRDGKRPASLLIDLYKQANGGKDHMDTLTLVAGSDNSWTNTVSNLPLYENGSEIIYTADVSEDYRRELEKIGYSVAIQGTVVHLYYTPVTGSVSTQINWIDNDDNDSKRPDAVTVTLWKNGKATDKTAQLDANNLWSYTWEDLDEYYSDKKGVGQLVKYEVKAESVDEYETTYVPENVTAEDDQPTISINMSHGENLRDVPVTLYWNDCYNADGKRPGYVKVQLYANGKALNGVTAVVSGNADENVWTGSFKSVPTYKDGAEIFYTVKPADNISQTYSVMIAGSDLYLSYNAEVGDLYVSFRFDDSSNADGYRPEGGYLQLQVINDDGEAEDLEFANAKHTVYFEADGRVNDTFVSLPIYRTEGENLKYTVRVTWDDEIFGGKGDKYNVSVSKPIQLSTVSKNQLVLTASREADVGTEKGTIYWFDNNNRRGNRPDKLYLNIYNDVSSNVLNYTVKLNESGEDGIVYNEAGEEKGAVQVREWGQNNEASSWSYTIEDLPQNWLYNDKSQPIYYWATARDTGLIPWYTTTDGQRNGLDVNLTHVNYLDDHGSSTQDYTVTINWLDNDNAWGYRPETAGIDVTLKANGTAHQTVRLTKSNFVEENENAWTYTFKDLPTYLDGSAVVWSVEAADIKWYITGEATKNNSTSAVIDMEQSIGFDFTALWNDNNDDDRVRPADLTVEVLADGTKVAEVELAPENEGEAEYVGHIDHLPVWRVAEHDEAVNYTFKWSSQTVSDLDDGNYTATATNGGNKVENVSTFYYLSATEFGTKGDAGLDQNGNYAWETSLERSRYVRDVNATVSWDDDSGRDGYRPESVMLQLKGDGKNVGSAVKVSVEDNWAYTWEDVALNKQGKAIVYTVELVNVPDQYTEKNSVSDDAYNRLLTHSPELVDVTATVYWMDNTELHYIYNSAGELIRTTVGIERVDVSLNLFANGEDMNDAKTLLAKNYPSASSTNGYVYGTAKWEGLYKYQNHGEEIKYDFTVTSSALDGLLADGYTRTYGPNKTYELKATITHDLYDVRGTVYFLYDTSDEFLLKNVPVTVYLYNETDKTYTAVGETTTDENGTFELLNMPQGKLVVRAVHQYGDYAYAGSVGLNLDRHDGEVKIVVDRDSKGDSDLYRYQASGKAFYQTDKTDKTTIKPVPADSIVLLYQTVNGQSTMQYVGMTTTNAKGEYVFKDLASGQYMVNVVFNYNDSTYTYDNSDAVANGLSFAVNGMDTTWADVVKQVNGAVDPNPGPVDPDVPVEPEPVLPVPCVVSGYVCWSNNGTHTTAPVKDVDVYVYAASNNAELAHTTTDEKGHWTVEGLGAQQYIAVFSYQANASRVLKFNISESVYDKGEYTVTTQYFDSKTTEPTASINGVVLDNSGNRINAQVQILNSSGELVDFAYVDKGGFYDFTVPAGYTYQVKIVEVGSDTEAKTAGHPDDALTTLDYYTVSGTFTANGKAQAGATVAIYQQKEDLTFALIGATLTDTNGNYTAKVYEAGNYKLVSYLNGQVYEEHSVSVGYQSWLPQVKEQGAGKYTISGSEKFDSIVLYDVTNDVVRKVTELSAASFYKLTDLPAGTYDLKMMQNGKEKHYYLDCPNNVLDVTYYVTVSGTVKDTSGKPVLGSLVSVFDKNGKQVGETALIIDGSFSYAELPAGEYTVEITYPVDGDVLANKTTADKDSYGKKYANGITENGTWTWNLNATAVRGSVKDQNGNALANATIVLRDNKDPSKAYGVQTSENGEWSVGVLPGSYTVDAMFEVDANHIYHATQTKSVTVASSTVSGCDLTINRFELTGLVVRDGDKKPVADADVVISYKDTTKVTAAKTDKDGKFSATLYSDEYVIAITVNGKTVTRTVSLTKDTSTTLTVNTAIYLSGIVYDTDGTTPVTDGIVYYTGKKSGTAYTDKNGKYEIALTAAEIGSYELYAEAAGNQSATVTVDVATDTVQNLTLIQTTPAVDTYTITGIVTDNEGNRLQNAVVTLCYGDDKTKTVKSSTNENGIYRFVIEAGTYYLTASYKSAAGYTYETNGETAVHVVGADQTDKNLTITLSYDVTIKVIDEDENAVGNARVIYTGASSGSVVTTNAGTVSVKLAGGEYDMQAFVGNRKATKVNVEISKTSEITLVMEALGLSTNAPTLSASDLTISGVVLAPNGDTVSGAKVNLMLWDKVSETWKNAGSTTSDSDGAYQFAGLSAGKFRVDVEFTLTETKTAADSNYSVKGYALDELGNPYVGATVTLYTADNNKVESVETDEAGRYKFLNVENADYIIEIDPANSSDNDEPVMDWVSATPDNVTISGTVKDVNGNPVEGATVKISNGDNEWKMTTSANGEYSFVLEIVGDYDVTITYLYSVVVDTDSYKPDNADANAPVLKHSNFMISGIVRDSDGNVVSGATVELLKDKTSVGSTTTDANGTYKFVSLSAGQYTVKVSWNGFSKTYDIDTGDYTTPSNPSDKDDTPDTNTIRVSGIVTTNHKTPLAGAVLTITNLDNQNTIELKSDKDGLFKSGELELGVYQIETKYEHQYGVNYADKFYFADTQKEVALVIVLSYDSDVNGDGNNELVFAGTDDKFDTADDFYETDVAGDSVKDSVFAGSDGKPGTADDYFVWPIDGEDKKVSVGEDRCPGTSDDCYTSGNKTIYVGEDGTPATEDDWYSADVDADGSNEKVFIGKDNKPNTDDDWYNKVVNGAEDAFSLLVKITMNGNGGTVDNQSAKTYNRRADLKPLPTPIRSGFDFNGWFTESVGGTQISSSDIANVMSEATYYAQWTQKTTIPSGGSAGGGGGGGMSGGVVAVKTYTVTFDSNGGSKVASQEIEAKGYATEPTAPIKEGFKFLGWYNDKTKFDFATTKISADLTLTAKWEEAPVSAQTDVVEHAAYISGFSDGTVRPTANITRAEVAMIFYRLLSDESLAKYKTTEHQFVDVQPGSWCETAIATLAKMNIVSGRGNGVFDPNAEITRAEFTVIASRFYSQDATYKTLVTETGKTTAKELIAAGKNLSAVADNELTNPFVDLASDYWAYKYIVTAATMGWVNGKGNNTFAPLDLITRAEVMTIVNRVLGRNTATLDSIKTNDKMIVWPDNSDKSVWYYLAVQEATNDHMADMSGDAEKWTAVTETVVGNT